jgi:cyclase
MLTKRIIPCLDVDAGRVVKGTNFVNIIDAGDPVELAALYNREGADELVFLDITASSNQRDIIFDVVAKTAETVFIPFTVGGGIRDVAKIRELLKAGADKVSLNTAAVQNPDLIGEAASIFGDQCIVVAVDIKKKPESANWEVYIHGGRTATGLDAIDWCKKVQQLGAGEILLTSMDRDGTQNGYDLQALKAVSAAVQVPVIASGGAGNVSHIDEALRVADAALLASLLHFRQLTIGEIKNYLLDKKHPIRML